MYSPWKFSWIIDTDNWEFMTKLCFITGAYGVGKSTLGEQLEVKTGIRRLKASTLIYDFLKVCPPVKKQVEGFSQLCTNQRALISAIKLVGIEEFSLLEGHTCLVNQKGEVQKIPVHFFQELGIAGIIVVSRNVEAIATSIFSRDGMDYSLKVVEQLQKEELAYTKDVADVLQIPRLHIDLDSSSQASAIEKIEKFVTFSCTLM